MEHEFQHTKTFRYQILNEESSPKKVMYALHGYGQLVEFFIRKFRDLPQDLLIVAPEGMHRFYVNGTNGRVGASWMTKEARESDIRDNISYLNRLDEEITKHFNIEHRVLFGFSQGGATAARWEQMSELHFDAVIIWACVFPPDLELVKTTTNSPHFFVLGDQDEFYSEEDRERLTKHYAAMDYRIIHYQGKHDLLPETLTNILNQIERI